MLDFPSLLYKGLRILMFQLSGVYCNCSFHLELFCLHLFLFRPWRRVFQACACQLIPFVTVSIQLSLDVLAPENPKP